MGAADNLAKEAARAFAADLGATRVYLFGSRARGDARPDSDYDFFVILPSTTERSFRRLQRAYGAVKEIDFSKDIIVSTEEEFEKRRHLKSSLEHEVAREGLLLYGR